MCVNIVIMSILKKQISLLNCLNGHISISIQTFKKAATNRNLTLNAKALACSKACHSNGEKKSSMAFRKAMLFDTHVINACLTVLVWW